MHCILSYGFFIFQKELRQLEGGNEISFRRVGHFSARTFILDRYCKIALILVELHSGWKKVMVEMHLTRNQVVVIELHSDTNKIFQQMYHAFIFPTLIPLPIYMFRTDKDFNQLRG